ncbi:hypothetical protein GF336_00235 [Candidatus Woesearchaeota archaeon]|nr:hypothetical protein [Candidatus Woesearchaeota archaeon]
MSDIDLKDIGNRDFFNTKDNRPKWMMYFDRVLWVLLIVLIVSLFMAKVTKDNCKIIENEATGESACITKEGACVLMTEKNEPKLEGKWIKNLEKELS